MFAARVAYLAGTFHCVAWLLYATSGNSGSLSQIPVVVRCVAATAASAGLAVFTLGAGLQPVIQEIHIAWVGVTYHYPETTWIGKAYGLLVQGLLLAAFIRMVMRFRRGERALGGLIGSFVLFFCCAIEEVLVANRTIHFLSLADLGIALLILPLTSSALGRIMTDATRLQELSKSLQAKAEEDYRTLFREMLDGFALHEILRDEEGRPIDYRYLAVNPAFERMTGLEANHVVGKSVLEVLPDIERHWMETFGIVSLTGEPAFFESFHAGLNKNFEVTAFRHAPNQLACIFADITERKLLEAKFHQAQKLESIGRLAGGVAHDFNNLLTVINGYSQLLLQDKALDAQGQRSLTEILKAGERAAGLTAQLLAYSRRQVLQMRPLDLNNTVQEMHSMLQRLVGEEIEVRVALRAGSGFVQADPHQLEQVIMNLVVNAKDAMPRGGKLLIESANVELDGTYAQSHPGSQVGRHVMLAVSDTGAGMDRETQQNIFEPFFTTKGMGKGTGLGLSTVQGIIAQSGGSIGVYSEPGYGTTFRIYLPALVEAASDPGQLADVPALTGHETVLVVEDQRGVLQYTVAALSSYGYRVLKAENRSEALHVFQQESGCIDLVLTDVIMPKGSGRELADELEKRQPGIRVLFMSGYTDDAIAHLGVLGEGSEFIQKPFNPQQLAAKVRMVLGR